MTLLKRYVAIGASAVVFSLGVLLAYGAFYAPEILPSVNYTRLDGSSANTAQLKGKVVLINFWATSCATCVKEMPQLVDLDQKFQSRGYETLAVAMQDDPPAYVIDFAKSRKLPFTVVIDNLGTVAKALGNVRVTPTAILVNKRAEVVKRYVGEPDFQALSQRIEQLLSEP
jgi:peroxiredoxin